MSSYEKGARYERELVKRLLSNGWGALRLAASGGGGDADLPDVFAGRPVKFGYGNGDDSYCHPDPLTSTISVELKSGEATTLYVNSGEVEDLESFAERWGARPYLGARSTRQGTPTATYLIPLDRARMTPDGNYGLPIDEMEERADLVVDDDGVGEP